MLLHLLASPCIPSQNHIHLGLQLLNYSSLSQSILRLSTTQIVPSTLQTSKERLNISHTPPKAASATMASPKPQPAEAEPKSIADLDANDYYLFYYNTISGGGWFYVLVMTLYTVLTSGPEHVFETTGEYCKWIQSLASLEIHHTILGLVRSPVVTTVIQISSRLLVVWGIFYYLPESPVLRSWWIVSLFVSWGVTEVIRYFYYATNIRGKIGVTMPPVLSWLRYNTFYVLYPTGITSEMAIIYYSLPLAQEKMGFYYALFLKIVLVIYIPGSYVMYTHMMRQRKRVIKKEGKKKM